MGYSLNTTATSGSSSGSKILSGLFSSPFNVGEGEAKATTTNATGTGAGLAASLATISPIVWISIAVAGVVLIVVVFFALRR